jgi:hypothetical protein
MIKRKLIVIFSTFCLVSCATITTKAVKKTDVESAPDGIRVFAPKVYIFVDAQQHKSTIVNLPDYSRAYDVKPLTIFAKQDFNIKLDVGQVSDVTSNQDTTGFLTFLKEAAQIGVKAGGLPAALTTVDGDFGLPSGVYTLTDDGKWQRVQIQ